MMPDISTPSPSQTSDEEVMLDMPTPLQPCHNRPRARSTHSFFRVAGDVAPIAEGRAVEEDIATTSEMDGSIDARGCQ